MDRVISRHFEAALSRAALSFRLLRLWSLVVAEMFSRNRLFLHLAVVAPDLVQWELISVWASEGRCLWSEALVRAIDLTTWMPVAEVAERQVSD